MATLTTIITGLINHPNADNLRLNDGAETWDVYNLLDTLTDGSDDNEYSLIDDRIYRAGEDGVLEAVAAYTITGL